MALGCSAAARGEGSFPKARLDEIEQFQLEKAMLESLEEELALELPYQTLLEQEEALEIQLLDKQIKELEIAMNRVSMTDPTEVAPAVDAGGLDIPHHPSTAPVEPAASVDPATPKPVPDVDVVKVVERDDGKRASPDSKHLPKSKHDSELPQLSPSTKQRYRSYWARFVAAPQNQSVPAVPPVHPSVRPPLSS